MALWIDVPTAELDDTAREFIEVVARVLRRQNDIDAFLEDVNGIDLADVPWPGGTFRARTFWTEYVPALRASARLRNVVEKIHAEFPHAGVEKFLRLSLTPQGGWYTETDPLKAQFAGPGRSQPIFDRGGLRQEVMLLHEHGYRTLNITGVQQSGKTFSIQLVQLLSEREKLEVAHVDIADWGTSPFSAVDLITTVAADLKIDLQLPPLDSVPDPHTRARQLVVHVRGLLSSATKVRWLIIDGLDRKNVEPDATAFVERLMKSIDVDGKPSNVRLVVTGFKGLQPDGSRLGTLSAVTRDDVQVLFVETSRQLGRTATDEQIAGWTNRVWTVFDPKKHDLGDLGDAVYEVVRTELVGAGT